MWASSPGAGSNVCTKQRLLMSSAVHPNTNQSSLRPCEEPHRAHCQHTVPAVVPVPVGTA